MFVLINKSWYYYKKKLKLYNKKIMQIYSGQVFIFMGLE